MQLSRLFWLTLFFICCAGLGGLGGWLWAGRRLRKEAEVKKMSSKTFREWAELSYENYRQRKEREEDAKVHRLGEER